MEQVTEFIVKLFEADDWPARWVCGNWSSFHGWLYITSNIVIWLAYFVIPNCPPLLNYSVNIFNRFNFIRQE
ncbi:MAG: hypothetical protein QY309_07135 [Cyclobacteriaceae bacterium]|nr:MAG: hypothetical protein QY309_07135 [Cyclobacteriaceae bacterium]